MFNPPREALEFEARVSEVDQEPNLDTRGVEVIDDLSFVLRGDGLDRLELDQHSLFNEKVGVEVAYGLTPEVYGNGSLRLHGMPDARKRYQHGLFIHGLQEPSTELIDHFKCTSNN